MPKQSHSIMVTFFLSLTFLLVVPFFAFAEETLTITTYYPSPYGSYRELRSQRMAIGDNYIKVGDYDWGDEINNDADLVVEGNVGIGTTNPAAKLDLQAPANSRAEMQFSANNGGANMNIEMVDSNSVGETETTGLQIETGGAGINLVKIESSGNVGIGTTSPSYTLHLKSGTNPVLNLENPTAGSWIRIDPGNAGSENWLFGANDAGMEIYSETDSVARLLVNNSGNVGIGVDSPTQKLDIDGQVRIRGGAPAAGRVLTSDANGNATWQASSGSGATINYSDCVIISHTENAACAANSWGTCPNNYVMVGLTTGLRYPGVCTPAQVKCCRLQ